MTVYETGQTRMVHMAYYENLGWLLNGLFTTP